MKVVQINVVCNGSTGKIMCDLATELGNKGHETYIFFGRGKSKENLNCKKIGNKFSVYFHVLLGRLGFNGHGSYFATKRLVNEIRKINPDIIHLHNIHGYYLNLKILFDYLKKEYKGKVVWTLHDCWAFTGHCSHFTLIECDKWKKQCRRCPDLCCYPRQIFDTTEREYKFKKEMFLGVNNLILTTPSSWLKGLVEMSFLKKYDVKVINNGINLNIFKPTYDDSIFEKYCIPRDKKVILGVANVWDAKKGLNVFFELSKIISDDEVIVLVGLNQKQMENLPDNIVGIKRTDNQVELAVIYTLADVFINPSIEETFSLVAVEAMACGQQVIVCNSSAPKELISVKTGIAVSESSARVFYEAYKELKNGKFSKDDIVEHAGKYSKEKMIKQFIDTYETR